MNKSLGSFIGIVLFSAALACNAAETKVPDCVGLRLGMSVTEAQDHLKSYDPKLEVQSFELNIPSLGEKPVTEILFIARPPDAPATDPIETLQAAITLPPNKPVVWKVVRSLRFEPGHEQTKAALLAALHEKYGDESLTLDMGSRKVSLCWVVGADGIVPGQNSKDCLSFCRDAYFRSAPLDSTLGGGSAKEFVNNLHTLAFLSGVGSPRSAPANHQVCQSMTYIVAELSLTENPELVKQMRVTLIDAPLEIKATEATRAVIDASKAAKAKEEIGKAVGNPVPKL